MAKKKAASKKSATQQNAKKPTKDEQLAEAAELLARIERAEKACQDYAAQMQIQKEEYKLSKEAYGNAVVELRRLCRMRSEKHPLFDQAKKPEEKQAAGADTTHHSPLTSPAEALPEGAVKRVRVRLVKELDVFDEKRGPGEIDAFEDKDGGVFLSAPVTYTGQHTVAFLEAEEFEPVETAAAGTPGPTSAAWRELPLSTLSQYGCREKAVEALEATKLLNLGELAQVMQDDGTWWAKNAGVNKRYQVEVEDSLAKLRAAVETAAAA
jgi:hypothetical protein